MTTAYFMRLLCLCLAAFFLLHLAAGSLMAILSPLAIRAAERMTPRRAARFLFEIRLVPAVFSLLVVIAICAPSYLWLEPRANVEDVSLPCLAAAFLGSMLWTASFLRVLRAAARSHNVVKSDTSLMAVVGLVHPRLIISRDLLAALPPDELLAAIRHEEAHRVSRDNLKRLLMLLTPGILPGYQGFAALDRAWAKFTEWSADDCSVDGDERRSVSLASALVRAARLGTSFATSGLMTSLLGDERDLSQRVERLLRCAPPREEIPSRSRIVTLVLAAMLVVAMLQPATLYSAHRLLEYLTH